MANDDFGGEKLFLGVALGAMVMVEWMESQTLKKSIRSQQQKPKLYSSVKFPPKRLPLSLKAKQLTAITPLEKKKRGDAPIPDAN